METYDVKVYFDRGSNKNRKYVIDLAEALKLRGLATTPSVGEFVQIIETSGVVHMLKTEMLEEIEITERKLV